jgi:putative ABC transport system permease protein
MPLIEAFRSALSAITANALRSSLTMLGIVIGVAAVIAMVAIGSGARNLVDQQIRSLGANLAVITPGNVTQGGARLGAGAASTLTDEDAAAIKTEIEGVTAAAPFVRGQAQVVNGAQNWSTGVFAIDHDGRGREWEVADGRASIRGAAAGATSSDPAARPWPATLFGRTRPARPGRSACATCPVPVRRRHGAEGPVAFGQDQDDVIFVPLDAGAGRVIGRNYAKTAPWAPSSSSSPTRRTSSPGIELTGAAAAPEPPDRGRAERTILDPQPHRDRQHGPAPPTPVVLVAAWRPCRSWWAASAS